MSTWIVPGGDRNAAIRGAISVSVRALFVYPSTPQARPAQATARQPLALPSLPAPDLSGVQSVEIAHVGYVPWVSLTLPDLATVSSLWVHDNSALTDLVMPALTRLGALQVSDNPALTAVSILALGDSDWQIDLEDNLQLCATDIPLIAAPPPGCAAFGSGNACDP